MIILDLDFRTEIDIEGVSTMRCVRKLLIQNIFQKNEHIFICRDEFAEANPNVPELSAIRYFAISSGEGMSYEGMLNSCCREAMDILCSLRGSGFQFWVLVIGPLLSRERLVRINDYSVLRAALSQGLSKQVAPKEKCYESPVGVRYAGVFEISRVVPDAKSL